jgi:hypothetical protein
MKKIKVIFRILARVLIVGSVFFTLQSVEHRLDSKVIAEFKALNDKISRLEQEQQKNALNVTQSLERFQERIWWCEDNIALQNTFMAIEYDNFQVYYEKNWRK